MKNMIKLLALLSLALAVALAFCSCGEPETPPSTQSSDNTEPSTAPSNTQSSVTDNGGDDVKEPIDYTIRAVDAFGNELEVSVIVEMFKDGESLGEKPIRRGSAVYKLEPGEYTFEVKPMEGEFYYDKNECVLDEEVTEKTITLYNYADSSKTQTIWVYDDSLLDHVDYEAVTVEEGGSYVKIDRPAMSYYIFTPTRGGIYRFSYEASKSVTIGYFGSPHNVLQACPLDVVDGTFEIEVKNEGVNIGNEGGTTQLVIGIRSYTVKGCVLKIERVGDAKVDLPFTDVTVDKSAIKQDNYLNSEFVDFDITDKNLSAVYNENDGFYHLNTKDGPVIFVRINTALIKESTDTETIYAYLPSFVSMCGTDRLCKYFYDDDGNVVLKESYNDMFYGYEALCGTMGMYPLNEQLATVIKNLGEHRGWFDLDSELHIFGENVGSVVAENAWLFACAYEVKNAKGTLETPAPVAVNTADAPKTYAILAKDGEGVVLRTVADATLTISNADGIKVVANNGTEYEADANGKISVVISGTQNFTVVYDGEDAERAIYFTFVEYFG